MNEIRYIIALFMVVGLAPLLLFWFFIHPFVGFWRRVGPVATYLATGLVIGVGMIFLYTQRRYLLTADLGTSYPLVALGLICLLLSAALRISLGRHMPTSVLLGLSELAPTRYPVGLCTSGIYSRIRHPRYLQFLLAVLGYSLLANYLASYIVLALWFVGIPFIAVIEERELRNRFGTPYEEYCRRVPRFLPRLKNPPSRRR